MKKIVNIKNPKNVIIVDDAYVVGDRIVCTTETDDFDLWRSCWSIQGIEPEVTMTRLVALAKQILKEVPPEFWEFLGVGDLDTVRITVTKEETK